MKVAYLGPAGSFTHTAAINLAAQSASAINKDTEFVVYRTITALVEAVNNSKVDFAVVPVENSIAGGVGETIDALLNYKSVYICREHVLNIKHCLLASVEIELNTIEKVLSHPMSFAQCGEFLRSNLTKAELEPCASNSAAAQNLKDLKQKNIAAIAPEFCASIYDLKILRAGINDLNNNQTRFWLLSKDSSLKLASRPEKSSLVFQIIDEPGSLFNILKAFTKHQVNITRIESRPAKDSLGSYLFCIDFAASREDERFSNIMKEVSMYFNYYRWLGSYSSTN